MCPLVRPTQHHYIHSPSLMEAGWLMLLRYIRFISLQTMPEFVSTHYFYFGNWFFIGNDGGLDLCAFILWNIRHKLGRVFSANDFIKTSVLVVPFAFYYFSANQHTVYDFLPSVSIQFFISYLQRCFPAGWQVRILFSDVTTITLRSSGFFRRALHTLAHFPGRIFGA